MGRAGLVCLPLLAVLLLASCGTSGDRRQVQSTVERFNSALERDDGEGACGELTEGARSELEGSEKKPCEEAILTLELEPSEVSSVRVFIVSASADLAGGTSLFLDETSRGWKISALGCQPRPGDQPYDCELEA